VVYAGEIVEIGDARELLANPRHRYTRQLIEAVPSLERRRAEYGIDSRAMPSLVRPIGFTPEVEAWLVAGDDHFYRQEA